MIIFFNDILKKNGKVSKEKYICYREWKKIFIIIGWWGCDLFFVLVILFLLFKNFEWVVWLNCDFVRMVEVLINKDSIRDFIFVIVFLLVK